MFVVINKWSKTEEIKVFSTMEWRGRFVLEPIQTTSKNAEYDLKQKQMLNWIELNWMKLN